MKSAMASSISDLTAKDIMKKSVIFATADMTISELAELFETENITGAPVVDFKGKAIGVVSETDIVATDAMKEPKNGKIHRFFKAGSDEEEAAGDIDYESMLFPIEKTVEDIMTPWLVSVTEDTPIVDIADKMFLEHVHRVLVMDSKGHLKGIVSSMDLVQVIADWGRKGHI